MTLRTPPWTFFAVEGVLEKILDLVDLRVQNRLNTSVTELTGDWRYSQSLYRNGIGELPPTQLLGKLAYESGKINGIRYHSARRPGRGFGYVVFADQLVPGGASFLDVYDPHDKIRQRLP